MLLQVSRVNTFYGLSHVLFDVSLEVDRGETVCILGRNGVGKTTTLRSIIGFTPPRTGSILFEGQEIVGFPPHKIARMGIGLVPEDRIIFPDLTVRENLEIGMRIPRAIKGPWNIEKMYSLFPVLKTREEQEGGTLSGGEQQMLTIARTLVGNPVLLLLDEPSEGLAPLIVRTIQEQIDQLKKEKMTILICEQDLNFALDISDRSYILEKGHICWDGQVAELRRNPEVMEKFMGL